ncbi:MAG: hypothetical protein EXS08_08850 [Planctomycetes bacterium]|nr:hypothetical protein [Planctomycetota bacterium]
MRALSALCRTFGPKAARQKRVQLERLGATRRLSAAQLVAAQETLLFLLAYPDDPALLAAARAVVPRLRAWTDAARAGSAAALGDTGLPGSAMIDTYGFPLLARLTRLFPGALEIDWDEAPDTGKLQAAVVQLLHGAEVPGLDDITLEWDDWFAVGRSDARQRDLELLLELFTRAPLSPTEREWRFDGCELPVRWQLDAAGSARSELLWLRARPHFRRRAPTRSMASFAALVRRPLADPGRLARAAGQRFVDFAAAALAVRQSEIRPLSYGNAEDVTLVECGTGLIVALIGVVPGYREALESLYTVLLLQNGVPIAYGPASVSAGCCELGLNLFDEFRGVETRHLYAQYLRVVHHVLGARYFFLTPYGMGAGNPEALRTGSFWFYRRLGFRPTNARVETLARAEEQRLARTRGARSDLKTLRRLADTAAYLDLSGARCQPLPLGRIGLAVTRRLTHAHGGEREPGLRRDVAAVRRALDLRTPLPRAALELLAPLLALDPELARRPRRDREALGRFLRAKSAPSEVGADAQLAASTSFLSALRRAATPEPL